MCMIVERGTMLVEIGADGVHNLVEFFILFVEPCASTVETLVNSIKASLELRRLRVKHRLHQLLDIRQIIARQTHTSMIPRLRQPHQNLQRAVGERHECGDSDRDARGDEPFTIVDL